MTTPLEPMCDAELQLLAVLAASCPDTPDEVLRLLAEVERLRRELTLAMECVVSTVSNNEYLRTRVATLEGVLREVEWQGAVVLTVAGYPPNVVAVCPICQKPKKSGHHYSDCALDAALREDE